MMVRRTGDWICAKVGEELVMMSAETDSYIGLSEVGARIWEIVETPRDVAAICAQLQTEFDVPAETCRREVELFLDALAKEGAVTLGPEPAG